MAASDDPPNLPTAAPRPSWTVLPALDAWADPPATVLDYLARNFPRIAPETWADRMDRGRVIRTDRTPLHRDAPYEPHLRVGYFRELPHEERNPLEEKILFRSEHLLVVDKPPFLPVVPSGRFVNECLIYRVERRLGLEGVAPIHRLDRMTSGLVMLSPSPEARGAYGTLFENGEVEKVYEALCWMPEEPKPGEIGRRRTVESVIEPGEPWFRMRSRPAEDGETPNARTLVELVEWKAGLGRFRLRPATGKTHQLRVHAASIDRPIFRDPLYPELQPKKPDDFSAPMALLARSLRFVDPFRGETVRFRSTLDLEFPASTEPT